jgi:hypothetical protein
MKGKKVIEEKEYKKYCDACDKKMSPETYKIHITKDKHIKKMIKHIKNKNERKKYCICCDKIMSYPKYKIHKEKDRHKENFKEYTKYKLRSYGRKRGGNVYISRHCKTCNRFVSNYSAHKRTAYHMKALFDNENKEIGVKNKTEL